MSKAVLVDANILIDAAVPGRAHHQSAILLENEIAYSSLTAYVAATSLKDAYYLIKRETDAAFAREYVQCLMQLYTLAPVDAPTCEDAIASNEPDFEDGIVRSCAEYIGVDYIISHDEKAFKNSTVKRISAQSYLDAHADLEEIAIAD